MLLTQPHADYSTTQARKRLVDLLSTTIDGHKEFIPYKPNDNDDYFWTLDSGNN